MTVIGWIIFGLVVGIVAKFLMPGRDPGGFILTVLLGIAGALLGGYLGRAVGLYREGDPVGFIMAVGGSIPVLILYRVGAGRPRRASRLPPRATFTRGIPPSAAAVPRGGGRAL